jgi:predicted dehydrogenase (TIGR03970 family)
MQVTQDLADERLERRSFDYIVVGAGASGSALAASLTDDAACQVLLIEAGRYFGTLDQYPELLRRQDKHTFSLAPSQSFPSPSYARFSWAYEGRLNEFLRARIVRGRVVGGSSAINGASFTRGRPQDYDTWAAAGNTEWSYERLLPAFRAVETDLDFGDTELHGARGPIRIRRTPENDLSAMSRLFIDAVTQAGHPWDPDLNGRQSRGVGLSPNNSIDGVRQNAGAAFIGRVIARPNLYVLDRTQVRRVLLEKGRAVGVEAVRGDAPLTLRGSEVILCAGGLNSPHLLMLSGLGPAAKLANAGIRTVQDLPYVGQNLADHTYVVVPFTVPSAEVYPDGKTGGGLMLHFAAGGGDEDSRIIANIRPRNAGSAAGAAMLGFNCTLGTPVSTGEIVLRASSPERAPIIEYNYLSEPEDRRRMRECVRFAARIVDHPAYTKIGAARTEIDGAMLRDDGALDHWIATHLWTAYHSSGTCKMGPDRDEMAMVDQHCRVRGVEGLRVADTSILPALMTRGVHATAVMVGEHAASLIRRERAGQIRVTPKPQRGRGLVSNTDPILE